jgi:hypothetical protein
LELGDLAQFVMKITQAHDEEFIITFWYCLAVRKSGGDPRRHKPSNLERNRDIRLITSSQNKKMGGG